MKTAQLPKSTPRSNAAAIAGMPTSAPDPANRRSVEFVVEAPKAQDVYLAGTFNNWDPRRTPMKKKKDGKWHLSLQLSPGRHEYRYIVDGQWASDPTARQAVENPFGGENSVVTIQD